MITERQKEIRRRQHRKRIRDKAKEKAVATGDYNSYKDPFDSYRDRNRLTQSERDFIFYRTGELQQYLAKKRREREDKFGFNTFQSRGSLYW